MRLWDKDIDEVLMVPKAEIKVKLTPAEAKVRAHGASEPGLTSLGFQTLQRLKPKYAEPL